jgi:hypothetical protein
MTMAKKLKFLQYLNFTCNSYLKFTTTQSMQKNGMGRTEYEIGFREGGAWSAGQQVVAVLPEYRK